MYDSFAFEKIIGDSAWTRRIRRRVMQVANYQYPVLIMGPSGSGRELVARAVHAHSSRADHPFVPFRCSFVPASLRASQLFGQAAGAPGLVKSSTLGCFGAAERGTLFLDEVSDLDFDSQAQLLQALREKRVVPFGSETETQTNVRLLASTSRDLDREVQARRFNPELLRHLNVLTVEVDPLRERIEDIEPLVRFFIARFTLENGLPLKRLTPAAMALLQVYRWPGNVAQLCDVVEQAVLRSDYDRLGPDAFATILDELDCVEPEDVASRGDRVNNHETVPHVEVVAGQWQTLAEVEAEHIRVTLIEARHNQQAAARMLQVPLSELASKIARYRIRVPQFLADRDAHEVQ